MTEISYFFGNTVSSGQTLLMKKMKESKGASFLHLVPTRGRVMELETDSRFWVDRRVNTLTGVMHRIFDEDIRPERYHDHSHIDQILRQLLIKKVLVNRSLEPRGLAYFHSLFPGGVIHKDYPGICRNISGFFSTLYRNNYEDIYANDLGGRIIWQEEKEPGSADEKYALESDLLWLMGDYEELKRDIKGYDDDDIIRNVRDFLKENNNPSYLMDFNVIILDSLTQVSRIEEEILFHLSSSVNELWWLIDYESNTNDPLADFQRSCGKEADRQKGIPKREGEMEACRICYSIISLMARFHEAGFPCNVEKADMVSYPNPYAGAIYANKSIDENITTDTLKIGSFPEEVDEVRAIASEIKRIILEKGENPGHIRVIFPDLSDYASIVSEIFTEYGLPFSLTKGIPLSSHPLSHIFLKILQLPLEEFRREDLFSLFSLKIIRPEFLLFEFPDLSLDIYPSEYLLSGDDSETLKNLIYNEEPGVFVKRPDIFLFDTALRRCGIARLGKDIENISDDRISLFREIYSDTIKITKNPDEKKSLRSEYYNFLYQRVIFRSILLRFKPFLNCDTPENIVEMFRDIIALLGFPANIIDLNSHDEGLLPEIKRRLLKRDIRAFTLLNELINVSHREITLAKRLFDIEKSDALLASFYSALNSRINNKYLLDERNPDVIRVSQWLETRGRSFDYVFAGGLTAGRFPLKEEPDFIIPESSRGIFRIIDPVDQSKQLFSNLLKNYEKGLYLSYPETISERPVQASQVIQDLYALIESSEPEKHDKKKCSWNAGRFYTTPNELLNAARSKGTVEKTPGDLPFYLRDIIIKDVSSEEDIIRGIKTFACRSAENGLFEYDGLVEKAHEFCRYERERNKIFSSSSLETLANCPMRYLFQYCYRLKDIDEITPEATSRDLGQFVHDILKIFYKKLAGLKTNVFNLGIDRSLHMAEQVMAEYLKTRSILKQLDFAEFHELEIFSGLNKDIAAENREGVIASLLRYEYSEFMNRKPEGVESGFGEHENPVRLGNVYIRGCIDRFDRDINSPETVYIYDYKTGFIKPAADIKKGLAFQLPVYIKALQSNPDVKEISAAFYSLKRNAFLENAPLKNFVYINSSGSGINISGTTLIDEFTGHLAGLVEKGIFHHSADGNTCEYCEFKFACHKNERRMDYLMESNPGLDIYSGKRNMERWQEVDNFRKEWKKICQSMEKAETLKTASARKKHYETVVEFRNDLMARRDLLPFTAEYMDTLVDELDRFDMKYNS